MSNQVNTDLLELASEHISYWEGEGIGKVLEKDIERNDLESLAQNLKLSAKLIFDNEYNPEELQERADELRQELKEDGRPF